MSVFVIGVDPGPTTGVAALHISDGRLFPGPHVVQCDHQTAPLVVQALLRSCNNARGVLAIERFVVRGRAARSANAAAGEITRNLIGVMQAQAPTPSLDIRVVQRAAGEVKPWATDARLTAAGLLAPTKGMSHARDAARHALFAAVRDAGLPDPLSRHNRNEPQRPQTSRCSPDQPRPTGW